MEGANMGRGAAKEIESSKAEETNYLRTELSSLGIECKRKNEFNDYGELDALATTIKEVYFQDYKTAYSDDDCEGSFNHSFAKTASTSLC
jgi:hypothetical protein